MASEEDLPRDLMDRIIRRTLPAPANLRAFLRRVVPDLADGFDCERARLLEREIIGKDWRRRESDLPFEVPYRTGEGEQTALVYLLVEHQSDTDPLMPLRVLQNIVGYWDKQREDWSRLPRPRPTFRLRPVLPIVLYTGPTPWGSNRTLADLLGEPAAFHRFAPASEPLFWNLAEQTAEDLLRTGEQWLQMLAVFRAGREDEEAFRAVYAEAMRGFARLQEADESRWSEFIRSVVAFAFQRRPEAERTTLRELTEQANPVRSQEVQTMTRTIADALREEGRAEARAEVRTIADALREEGRAEGRAEGELRASRKLLRQALEQRFQSLPESVTRRIEETTDLERLQAAVLKVSSLGKLEDLRLE